MLRGQVYDRRKDHIWNFLTVLVLILFLAVIFFSVLLYIEPRISLNPYPPPTQAVALVLPTATPLPEQPTSTPTQPPTSTLAADAIIATVTASPSAVFIDASLTLQLPTATETEFPSSASAYAYRMQGQPAAIAANIFNPELDNCSWMGVAGQVQDIQDHPITGILVLLGGRLDGKTLNVTTMTGTALNYGPAGFEFKLADYPIETQGKIWVQLVDQEYIPLSAKVYFDTFAEGNCDKNLIIINFKQVR